MKYDHIFVLSPGRSGSKTFAEACKHLINYTSAHESRGGKIGEVDACHAEDQRGDVDRGDVGPRDPPLARVPVEAPARDGADGRG